MIMREENQKIREMLELLEIEKAYKDGMLSHSQRNDTYIQCIKSLIIVTMQQFLVNSNIIIV